MSESLTFTQPLFTTNNIHDWYNANYNAQQKWLEVFNASQNPQNPHPNILSNIMMKTTFSTKLHNTKIQNQLILLPSVVYTDGKIGMGAKLEYQAEF